jgi:hypothetical protein
MKAKDGRKTEGQIDSGKSADLEAGQAPARAPLEG